MTLFWLLAISLAVLVALTLAVPVLRRTEASARRGGLWIALSCLIGAALAAALYLRLTNWTWDAISPQLQQSMDELNNLRSRAERFSQDVGAWNELGSAYARLEQFPAARRAFDRANRLADGRNAASLTGLAEALILGGAAAGQLDASASARANELFEQALKIEPDNGKALFYTAVLAMQNGNPALARERFATMRRGNLPDAIAASLDRQIAALDQQLKLSPADASTTIHLAVRVSEALRSRLPPQAPLFVFVRGAAGGPPLAVKRLSTTLPTEVTLSAADSMLAGSKLQPGQKVTVVARLSAGGGPVAQSGDPYGELVTTVGKRGVQELLIDRLSP